ncbi:MAG: lipopolysaccharide kinase InaA family protein [Phycisphaerae bacterium]
MKLSWPKSMPPGRSARNRNSPPVLPHGKAREVATLDDLRTAEDVFAIAGEPLRVHSGRSVTAITLNGKTHYLKRYWFLPSRPLKRNVARGLHELRMIDWLNENGFAGPNVVWRGCSGAGPFTSRLCFLMEEAAGELPLEASWRRNRDDENGLIRRLASFAASLHDAGFVHTDFLERHIMVGRTAGDGGEAWTFRLIDLERSRTGCTSDRLMAEDLATLAASIMDGRLRHRITTDFLEEYMAQRRTLSSRADMRELFAGATPTGSS